MPPSSKEACLADLRHRILMTDLEPGLDLDETRLADHYGLSRTPLREVLQRLAGDGYVTLNHNRGAKVAPMHVAAMRTFFQTAPMVYANIARLAAEHRTPAQLNDLQAAQDAFMAATGAGDVGATALANHQFHDVIGQMAHNPYLYAALARLLIDHTRLSQTFYRPASAAERSLVDTAGAQHDAMIAAITARDITRVTDLSLEHWDLSRDRLERFVRPDPLPLDVALKDPSYAV